MVVGRRSHVVTRIRAIRTAKLKAKILMGMIDTTTDKPTGGASTRI